MRRLPVYFVVDVSESMVGQPIEEMESAIESIVAKLRQDPQCLETVYVSVIAFAGRAKVVAPLVDLVSFYPPKLPIGGGTSVGRALDVLMRDINDNVKPNTYEQKGDWNPLVFFITDGKPTDSPQASIKRLKEQFPGKAKIIVVTLGWDADAYTLSQISDNVIALENTDKEYFASFVEWVSNSVKVQSMHLEIDNTSTELPILPSNSSGISIIKELDRYDRTDPSCITLTGRCSETKRPYLIKYKSVGESNLDRFIPTKSYHLVGAYPVNESYFDWSDERYAGSSINTTFLDGVPSCPHCNNQTSFAMCECGKLTCVGFDLKIRCPWCNNNIEFGNSSGEFSIDRGQG